MTEIIATQLPGVGTRHDFACAGGRRVGVITRHSGRRELIVYGTRDPDAVAATVDLTPDESRTLAEMLGGDTVVTQLAGVAQQIDGLAIDWLTLPSAFEARTIGATEMRARTGVSIIAVVRDDVTIPAPAPDSDLRAGDVVVVTGTAEGIEQAASILGA